MTGRVLVAEDEQAIADALAYALRHEGYEVEVRTDGDSALAAALVGPYDVLVLDVMLPGLSGLEVCRRLRAESDVPMILVTARDSEGDRVLGLELGADDYVTKPFSMAELMSRVRAILRRRELDRKGGAVLDLGRLRIDIERHEVQADGRSVRVTPSELRLLTLLANNPGRVFSRREIMQHLWQSEHVGDERAADMHVLNLRRKLARDRGSPELIATVRGAGYKLATEGQGTLTER